MVEIQPTHSSLSPSMEGHTPTIRGDPLERTRFSPMTCPEREVVEMSERLMTRCEAGEVPGYEWR